MKKSSKFLPVIGWSMWFAEYLFLERSWAKDENTLKGFVSAVSIMRDFVPAIYDTTVVIPKDSPAPTMLRILKGQSSVVHVRIKRHAMSDMPKSDEDVSKWCKDIFVAKDALLDKHIATGTFDEEIRPIGRPIVFAGGSVLVMPPAIWCLQILTVDSAPVNMERHYPLCCWIGAGDWHHACLHHVLAVRALELCQSSEESS